MVVVADTSPITALLHLQQIHLLKKLYGQVLIPLSVATELKTLVQFGYDVSFLEMKDVFIIRQPKDTTFINTLIEHLDLGEAEAIALAKEMKAELLLIDEKLGKEFALAENIHCKGVIGVLIDAKSQGLIKDLKPLLDDLIQNLKFRLSDKIYKLALLKAGEY